MKLTRLLSLVAFTSALTSAGCLGGAYTLVNVEDGGATELITREIPWDGSTALSLDVPSVVRYIQAPGPGTVLARGARRSVATLSVSNGRIYDQLLRTGTVLEITVTAPAIAQFYLNGRSRLSIEAYDQERLSLYMQGSAAVEAAGRARTVDVFMQGSPTANLARLNAESVAGDIGGSGMLLVAPKLQAKLDVHNFATTVLLTRPPDLITNLANFGQVIDAAPGSN